MKLKKKAKIILSVLISFLVFLLIFLGVAMYYMAPVDRKDTSLKEVVIQEGSSTRNIASLLKDEKIIKNEEVFLVYLKLRQVNNIYAAKYEFRSNMELKEVVDILASGGKSENEFSITFQEGWNMVDIAEIISKKTNHSKEEVLSYAKDRKNLDVFIGKYWFLTDVIKNSALYYPLEGYLFPDTYNFRDADVAIEEIFMAMLDQMENVLKPYKKDIERSNYSLHELLAMASMIEVEGLTEESKKQISGIIYNRMGEGMSLGIDATTYYALQIDVGKRGLTLEEFQTDNPYNTRAPSMAGKLPVGPISSVSKASIEAAIFPNDVDYLYYVTDKNGKFYYMKTYQEHEKVVSDLHKKGLWLDW